MRIGRGTRATAVTAALGVAAASLVTGLSARVASAAPLLDVPDTTVAVGRPLVFAATECPARPEPDVEQYLVGELVVGSGADAVRAGIVDSAPVAGEHQVVPMGWVDPAEPAVLAVRCVRRSFSGTETVVHTYPEVAIDVVAPAEPVPTLDVAFSRLTAAGGQGIRTTGSGCESTIIFELTPGTDLSFRTTLSSDRAAVLDLPVAGDGTWDGLLALNDREGPLAEGTYVLSTYCDHVPEDRDLARPVQIEVVGTEPSDQIELVLTEAGIAEVSGGGCTGGREVTVRWVGSRVADQTVEVTGDATASPSAGGSWNVALGDESWSWIEVQADCGDPEADGFRYLNVEASVDPGPSETTSTTSATPADPADDAPGATPIPATAIYTG